VRHGCDVDCDGGASSSGVLGALVLLGLSYEDVMQSPMVQCHPHRPVPTHPALKNRDLALSNSLFGGGGNSVLQNANVRNGDTKEQVVDDSDGQAR
jgi:hypothetical protein